MGSFRRSTFHREGGVVFGFDTETSTCSHIGRTSTPTRELDCKERDRRCLKEKHHPHLKTNCKLRYLSQI